MPWHILSDARSPTTELLSYFLGNMSIPASCHLCHKHGCLLHFPYFIMFNFLYNINTPEIYRKITIHTVIVGLYAKKAIDSVINQNL